ncbi:MAG: DUF2157 domain-containing protein [Planctomycetota bacterium]|nr:DUF2157 domain-containing protein [Planctomycetota bacterium]
MRQDLKISTRFKEQLRQELQSWQADGIINPEQLVIISQRYGLDQQHRESRNYLLFAIYVIGAALVGAGFISFVAAHWDKITPVYKIVLIVSVMLACHISGYYLWKISATSPRLGHALIVLGTLIFGANIGLLAQIFHIKADFYNGLFAWAIGAVVMAYALESIPNAIIAVVISFAGFCWWVSDNPHTFCYYPFVAAVVFLPFAYFRRSAITFTFSLLALGISILVCTVIDAQEFWAFLMAMAGVGLLYFGFGILSDCSASFNYFVAPAMVLGTLFIASNAYILSFKEFARHVEVGEVGNWMWAILVAAAYIIAILMWVGTFYSMLKKPRIRPISISVLISTVLLLLAIIGKPFSLYNDYVFIIIACHFAFVVLCIGLIASSFRMEDRRLFWAGILFPALIIATRFFEYETGLLLKAVVFTACGITLIFVGVAFENYLKRRRLANE